MRKKMLASVFLSTLAAGTAFACVMQAMPPFQIKVTSDDMRRGETPFAAFLRKLDEAGEKLMGAATWRASGFAGYVTVKTQILHLSGTNIQYVQKPCGQTAEESEASGDLVQTPPPSGGSSGGGGGSTGGGGVGGWNPPGGGGCYGNCQPPYGEVGDIQQV